MCVRVCICIYIHLHNCTVQLSVLGLSVTVVFIGSDLSIVVAKPLMLLPWNTRDVYNLYNLPGNTHLLLPFPP